MSRTQTAIALLSCLVAAAPALAAEESAISLKRLSDGSIIEYESAFCAVGIGESVSILLLGDRGDAAEATVVATRVAAARAVMSEAQHAENAPRRTYATAIIGMDGRTVEIAIDEADSDWKTVHLEIEISSGDALGVNLHSTPCDTNAAPV